MQTQLLENFLSTDNEVRKQAERQLENARNSEPAALVQLLIEGMKHDKLEVIIAVLSFLASRHHLFHVFCSKNISLIALRESLKATLSI